MGPQAYSKVLLVAMAQPARAAAPVTPVGSNGARLGVATSSRGAWRVAAQPEMHKALSNAVLRRAGFMFPSALAAM